MDKVDFTITDGSVEYRHSKPRAEYETRAPLVRLNFTIADGSDPDAVVRKVMDMAVRQVEGVLMGEDRAPGVTRLLAETPPTRRGRPPSKPTEMSSASSVGSGDAADPLEASTPETISSGQTGTVSDAEQLTLKGDIQPLAQKVSAHLAAKDGNINALRKVIKECGGNSLLTIPQENWPKFITEATKLLP